ncbi:MAG: ribonuclease Z [Clostridia bacterium]|nr:ribonuclease Z [Clostridia bacterium]
MNIIVCVDKDNGMLFNNRRLSKDKILCEKILEITSSSKLLMNEYTKSLFENSEKIIVDNNFLQNANLGDFCFIENIDINEYDQIEQVYIFNWNRKYPADRFFNLNLSNFKKIKTENFAGNSHEKITLEIYTRS